MALLAPARVGRRHGPAPNPTTWSRSIARRDTQRVDRDLGTVARGASDRDTRQGKNGPEHRRTLPSDAASEPRGAFIRNYKLQVVRALTPQLTCGRSQAE